MEEFNMVLVDKIYKAYPEEDADRILSNFKKHASIYDLHELDVI